MKWKVYLYRTKSGNSPVEKFITKLDSNSYSKVLQMIERLEKYGSQLTYPHSKKVANNLYELRIAGKSSLRIFYSDTGGNYTLLHIISKKTQSIPRKEIKTSLARLHTLL